MSTTTNKQALREAAEKALSARSRLALVESVFTDDGDIIPESQADISTCTQFNDMSNPATVLALLDELEAADNRINRLESIVAVAEKRNALMREWNRALKVPCDLVDDQVPVVIHGMVVRLDRLKEVEEKLAAAEKRIAVLGRYLKCAHAFIENTEAFGHEAASGILKCGDSEWNVDASKESLAAAGISVKGE